MNASLDRQRRVAALATKQHGVLSREHLLAIGLTGHTIDAWVRSGRLIVIHQGVYALGHASLTRHGRWLAAVLACGPTAVLSHGTAAALWELAPEPRSIHVTVRTYAGLTPPRGARLHRYRSLVDEDVSRRSEIPVTSPERTLLDLARVLPARRLRRAVAQADTLRLLDLRDADRLLAAHPRRPGAKAFAAAIADLRPDAALSRSDLEDRLVELCARHGLPAPELNVRIEGLEVDLVWHDAAVVAEADGYAFHRTRAAFERDRERDAILAAAGYRVHRFTDRQLRHRPEAVVAALRRSLSSSASL